MNDLYNPSTVAGTEYTRCYQIVVDNPAGRPPVATFQEERVLAFGPAAPERRWPTGQCVLTYDPATAIPILDPATGAATGATIEMAALYALLYSVYLYAARARDAAGGGEG